MLELQNLNPNLQARIAQLREVEKADVEAIPGYFDMQEDAQWHYEGLYLLACHPEFFEQLPDNMQDLHALLYFIFQYNLSNPIVNGNRIKIFPFNPVEWTQESGLKMVMKTGFFAPLLEKVRDLSSVKPLYFSVTMVSLILIIRPVSASLDYYLWMKVLSAMLEGRYDQVLVNELKENETKLEHAWVVNYLPNPAALTSSSSLEARQQIKAALLGTSQSRGMFLPPSAVFATPIPPVQSNNRNYVL